MDNYEWLQYEVLENPVSALLRFAVILVTGLLVKKIISHHISGLIYRVVKKKNGEITIEQFRELLHRPVMLFLTLITFYLAFSQLQYPPSWQLVHEKEFGVRMIVWKIFKVSIFVSVTWMFLRLIDYVGMVLLLRAKLTPDKADDQLVGYFKEAAKVFVVILAGFIMLGVVFEINVAGLIAGLGIGGIAIALAAKDTLENLLASFMIFLDKPFNVGDVIKTHNITGTVEKIGFRSTQLRTQERTLVIVPNRRMTDTEVENISQRGTIRANIILTLQYRTQAAEIEVFIQKIRDNLNANPNIEKESLVRVDRFSDLGVEISVIFYALTDKLEKFTRIREEVLLEMLRLSSTMGLSFSPRQVV